MTRDTDIGMDNPEVDHRLIEDMLFLAEKFPYLREGCYIGHRIKCEGVGSTVESSSVTPAIRYDYQIVKSRPRAHCPDCDMYVSLTPVSHLVGAHKRYDHKECCNNRRWCLKPMDTWLHYLVRMMNEEIGYRNVGVDWLYSDTPDADLATLLLRALGGNE